MPRWPLLIPLVAIAAVAPALAADENTPHPHQGVLAPYPQPPQKPELSADELATLAKGDVVSKQIKEDGSSGGRGLAVQDIHATPEIVWGRITDYGNYPNMVDNVDSCSVYKTEGEHIYAAFSISAMFVGVDYYIDHIYRPDQNYMTWTLDYSRESDLDDSVGFWYVEAIEGKPGWTRVYYSVDVRLRGWVPAAIENMIAKSGLTKATAWVKAESEKKAGN